MSSSIVIASWNGWHVLAPCLRSLARQTDRAFETIVVDNGSTDGTAAALAREFPDVRVIGNDDNRGFAEANNQGIRVARGEYIVLLNNDTEVDPGWLQALVAVAERDPRIGMVASRVVFWRRPQVINNEGIEVDVAGLGRNRHLGRPVVPCSAPERVFGPSATAALYRAEMLHDIGLLDPTYFAYCEDTDLAWRGRLAGWHAAHAPAAVVRHHYSATSGGRMSPFKAYHIGRNQIWTWLKNMPGPALVRWLPVIVAYDLMTCAYQLLGSRSLAPLRGRLDALLGLGPVLRDRRRIQRRRTITVGEHQRLLAWPLNPLAALRR